MDVSDKLNRPNPWTDKAVEAHWDRVASRYMLENNRVKDTHDQRFNFCVPYLKLASGQKILNITSRDGEAAFYLFQAEPNLEIINAEISQRLMEVAIKFRPWLKQVKLNSYSHLPFETESFDRVLSLETLEHVAEPLVFLKELFRVAKLDAILVLSCPPATSEIPYQIYTLLFGGHGEGPHKFPSSRCVKQWLSVSGWQLLHHEGTVLLPVGPASLRRSAERLIARSQGTFISELGIRQFYVCIKPR